MTKRQAIVNDIVTYLKTISISGGYLTTIADSDVFKWRTGVVPKTDQQIISVNDTGQKFNNEAQEEVLTIEIYLGCVKGLLNYTYITNMMQDVYKCLNANESSMRPKYGYLVIMPIEDSILIDQLENEIAEGHIVFHITYSVNEKWTIDSTVYS